MAGGRLLVAADPASRRGSQPTGVSSARQAPAAAAVVDACDARPNRALDEIRERGLVHARCVAGRFTGTVPERSWSNPRAERRAIRAAPLERRCGARPPSARPRSARRIRPRRSSARASSCRTTRWARCGRGIGSGKPRVNRVGSKGLASHALPDGRRDPGHPAEHAATTAELFDRARHRLSELPDHVPTAAGCEAGGRRLRANRWTPSWSSSRRSLTALVSGRARWRTAADPPASAPGSRRQRRRVRCGPRVGDGGNNRPGVIVGFAAPRARRRRLGVGDSEGAWQWTRYGGAQESGIVGVADARRVGRSATG